MIQKIQSNSVERLIQKVELLIDENKRLKERLRLFENILSNLEIPHHEIERIKAWAAVYMPDALRDD